MNKWFKDVKTVEELRKQYRALLKQYHPDNENGSVEITQEINAEYDRLFAILSKKEQTDKQSADCDKTAENEAFKEILNKIININADIEIVGSWVWITKGAFEYKELLKEVGFHYASCKKAWYWHAEPYCRRSKREISLDEIRSKYGSQKIKNKSRERQFVLN